MKLTLAKDSLTHSLNLVSRAVGVKPSLPVLNNILLQVENGQLQLAATNLETSITTALPVKAETDGAITVPARLLGEFVASLPNDKVTLEVKEENLVVTSGQFEATFAGINSSEFPKIPTPLNTQPIFLDKSFAKALTQTSFAASTDVGRLVLTGLLLEFSKKSLSLVATDGYRLAKKTLKIDSDLETTYLIPARALNEVARLLSETEEGEEISLQPLPETNQVNFTLGQTQITTRLLDGSFPPYQAIIPPSFLTRALLQTEELAQAVRSTALFARDLGNVVHLTLDPEKKEVALQANTAQVGTGKTKISGSLEGKMTTLALNSHYLAAGLGVLGTTQVSLEVLDSNKPVLLRSIGDASFFYIIMPVRLQG